MTHRFEATSKHGEVDKVAVTLERQNNAIPKSVIRMKDAGAHRAETRSSRSAATEDEIEDMWDNVPV